jgi:hypothetical protein
VSFLGLFTLREICRFGYWFTQELKCLLVRDQHLPALVYRQPPTPKGKRNAPPFELFGAWQWASDQYGQLIAKACERMPAACAAGLDGLADPQGLLRHCSEVRLDRIVRQTPLPATFVKKVESSLLAASLVPVPAERPWRTPGTGLDSYRLWLQWRQP